MSLSQYDSPNGSYTSTIPPGTRAFRAVIAEVFGFTRTEVVRDKSRCDATPSEHCECGAVDAFTTDFDKGRPFFDWCVTNADALGVQSVIFQHRQIGFGNPTERHRDKADHMDHVHVGLSRWARANLTEPFVRSLLPEEDDMFSDEDRDRLLRLESRLDALIVALGDKDPATAKAAWMSLGDARGDSLVNLAEAARNYAKRAKENTDPKPSTGGGDGGSG